MIIHKQKIVFKGVVPKNWPFPLLCTQLIELLGKLQRALSQMCMLTFQTEAEYQKYTMPLYDAPLKNSIQ